MTHDSQIGPELLKQNGIDPLQLLTEERAAIKELLNRERRRARLLKWIALASLTASVASIPLMFFILFLSHQGAHPSSDPGRLVSMLVTACLFLPIPSFLVACVSGILALFFSRSADRQALLAHLSQVESILRQPQPDAKSAPEARRTP